MECIHKATRSLKRSNARLILPAILIVPIIFSAGCGRHKAQVKTPIPPAPAAAPAQTPAKGEPAQAVSPQPNAEDNAYQQVGPTKPAIETAGSDFNFSPGPLIRIGLATDAKEIRISSKADYSVTEKKPEASPQLVHGEIQVRVEEEVDEDSAVYRVQAAAFTKMGTGARSEKKAVKKIRPAGGYP